MANYSANEKITQLDVSTTIAADDVVVFGDTSDSGKAKAITKANLQIGLNGAQVAATATDTTPGVLDNKISLASADGSVTIVKTVTNAGGNEVISYDFSAVGGGGSSGGLSKLQQTFTFSDFSGTTHAIFTDSLAVDAVPIGVVYDFISAFDSGLNMDVINSVGGGISISAPVDADTVNTLVATTDSVSLDFNATPNPVVRLSGIPTQGSVTVTVLYSSTNSTGGISTYVSTPLALTAGGTSTPTDLSSNTSMAFSLVNIPQQITFTKLTTYIGSLASAGTYTIAIYSEDGQTRLLNATSGTISAAGAISTITVSATTLPAGNYYIGAHVNGSGSMGLRSIVLDNLNVVPAGGSVLAGYVTITASTSPTTINPVSDITFNLYAPVLVRFDA